MGRFEKRRRAILSTAVAISSGIVAGRAHAAETSYTDLPSWQAAAGATTVETFDSASVAQFDTPTYGPVPFNGFSLSGVTNGGVIGVTTTGYDGASDNFPIPAAFLGQNYLGWGEADASGGVGPTDTFTFTTPTTAFGFDWFNTDETDQYEVTLNPTGTVFTGPPFTETPTGPATTGFFGVVSDAPITSITISTDFDGGYISDEGLDNFRVATSAGNNNSSGTVIWDGTVNGLLDTTTPNFQGGVPYAAIESIIFDDTAAGTTNVIVVSNTSTGSIFFNNNSLVYTLGGAALLINGSLNVSGGQSVTINNPLNVYTGMFVTGNGTDAFNNSLYVRGSMQLSNGGPATFNSSLNVFGGIISSGNGAVTFNSNLTVSSAGLINSGSGPLTFNGSTNITGPLSLTGSGAATFNGLLAVSSSGTFGDSSPVTLNGSSSFSSLFNLTTGTVTVGAAGSLTAPAVNVNSGASLIIQSGASINGVSGAPLVLTGNGSIALGGNAVIPAGTGTAYSGSLTGTGGLNLSGGYVTVGANNFTLTGPVTVGNSATSTAYLLVTDGSGTAGQTSTGSPITVTLSGTGPVGTDNGYAGALHTPDSGGQYEFSGNIVIAPVGAVISSGFQSTLLLNGIISGSGPVAFSTNADSLTILNAVNTYTGETRMIGNTGSLASADQNILRLGVDNAISTASGVNFIGSTTNLILDLNGHNQSVAYLTGGNPISQIANLGSSPSVLTLNTSSITHAVFKGQILDGSGGIQLQKIGPGTQTLVGNSTYSMGTVIAQGTLSPTNSGAIGTGPITMSGGTLLLPGVGTGNVTGFSSPNLNGVGYLPTVSSSVLQLTDGNTNETTSAFMPETITGNFTASFVWSPSASAGQNGGMTFVIENDPRGSFALGATNTGASNGGLGYSGIGNSVAAQYDVTSSKIGVGNDGSLNTTNKLGGSIVKATLPVINLPSQVTLSYNSSTQTIVETFYNLAYPGNVSSTSYTNINLSNLLGSTSAYIGFTGSTGPSNGFAQNISNFVFNNGNITNPVTLTNLVSTAANTSSIISCPSGGVTQIGALNMAAGSVLSIQGNPNTPTGALVMTLPSLSISGTTGAWTSRLDITKTALDLQSGTLAQVTNQVKQGYNAGGTTWQGSGGITSSSAASDSTHLSAVGVILNNADGNQLYGNGTTLGLFHGANPGSNDVLVKYTYYGDANLSGSVDSADYSLIDRGYLSHLTGWYNGDFNYDSVVNGSDYTLIDNAFNMQGASYAAELNPGAVVTSEIATDQIASTTSSVPEPGGVALGLIGVWSLRRRRTKIPFRV